jgi:hypothetical protein
MGDFQGKTILTAKMSSDNLQSKLATRLVGLQTGSLRYVLIGKTETARS